MEAATFLFDPSNVLVTEMKTFYSLWESNEHHFKPAT